MTIFKFTYKVLTAYAVLFLKLLSASCQFAPQTFMHPGIDQSAKDLAYMKASVLKGEEPYKSAFESLKAAADTSFNFRAHTHVLRGPYGRPNIGGDDLSRSANMAYNYALVWYITRDKVYAEKAINIINSWSEVLWDFDYNDAKLLAAWTGHLLCNAAELLRYSNAGWQQTDIDRFRNMMMTVYYPLLRYYYPQANGNWDGAIIHTILAIGIFTDNHQLFNNAVDHFLHAPFNGSVFKYVYPSGQCQETMRDQGHVQLGLGEFAGAAQVAFTQGVDLFAAGNNRLALGFEYTASYLLGEQPQSYGRISERARTLREDYELVYRHYSSRGVHLPYSKRAADSVRPRASRSVLTAVRALSGVTVNKPTNPNPSKVGYRAGAGATVGMNVPSSAIVVSPGEAVQKAIDASAGTGRIVFLKAGLHKFPNTLSIPSFVTIAGEGLNTVLFLDPASADRDAMVNAGSDLHDVLIRDLVIEASPRTEIPSDPNSSRSYRGGYNRGGIIFSALRNGGMKNISLINITVQNATYNGVFISGATNVTVERCDFTENGGSAVPGPALQHNLLLTHSNAIKIKDSRMDGSPFGSGVSIDQCSEIAITNSEIARNGYYGVLIRESANVLLQGNLIEANDRSGVMFEFLQKGSGDVSVKDNILQYNAGFGLESYATMRFTVLNNKFTGNGNSQVQEKVSSEKSILMK